MKTIIVFGSFVGNTETMAGYIRDGLSQSGIEADMRDVMDVTAEILDEYDLLIIGSPTYEPKMIQEDMLPFYDQLESMKLSGKLAAAFGPGDSAWPDFCTAVEMLEERLRHCGAELVIENHMVDGIVEEHEDETLDWTKRLAQAAKQKSAG
ncbi:MAG: flavodoxin domain-containing protein [Planctomycetales bacterium]|nr:flavodoxin domain-containing protein [bacterium]UNM07561.1 MAG: flavodoxin domain-containing protein [Planctomycetales bacterium]